MYYNCSISSPDCFSILLHIDLSLSFYFIYTFYNCQLLRSTSHVSLKKHDKNLQTFFSDYKSSSRHSYHHTLRLVLEVQNPLLRWKGFTKFQDESVLTKRKEGGTQEVPTVETVKTRPGSFLFLILIPSYTNIKVLSHCKLLQRHQKCLLLTSADQGYVSLEMFLHYDLLILS